MAHQRWKWSYLLLSGRNLSWHAPRAQFRLEGSSPESKRLPTRNALCACSRDIPPAAHFPRAHTDIRQVNIDIPASHAFSKPLDESTRSAGFSASSCLPQYATVLRPCLGELLNPSTYPTAQRSITTHSNRLTIYHSTRPYP
ncbi:hypothetical protein PCASD_20769 [Puccinia coronata f. sp. avenae]|uniref:Uncharacterized protein n=1 Tax=Puccinia coronata f. sp. avenae TaxID=200324 RepID=A0A2N5TMI6_9BASI|nr:hypothetical protein PCASD_20769 [Puccinia coronata f. sp. avenae]